MCSLCLKNCLEKAPVRLIWKRLKHKAASHLIPKVDKTADLDLKGSRILPSNVVLDPEVAEEMQKSDLKPRFHPGIMRLKAVKVPARMEVAAFQLSQNYGGKSLKKDSEKLTNVMSCRQVPPQAAEIDARTRQITESLLQKKNLNPDDLSAEEEAKLKKKVLALVKYKTHNWKPIKYDAYNGMTYMVARLAQNYSVLLQCLSEICKRDPDFVPDRMYNLGSGVGSAVWAVNELWGNNVKEHYCVDTSADMNTIARLLLQDADENKNMHIGGVYFRQFEPSSVENKFPLVISAYMLLELPDWKTRIKAIESLWERTTDYLLLVEYGTYAGHRLIQEARDHIIKISSQKENSLEHGHVFAPCPHDMICPKAQLSARMACTFPVKYIPMQIYNVEEGSYIEKFTYVLLRKRWPAFQQENSWPRFTMELKNPSKCVHCKICCPDGQFYHMIMTAKKHPKNLFSVAKKSDWGDRLPVTWPEEFVEVKKDTQKRQKYLEKRKSLDLDTKTSEVLPAEKRNFFHFDEETASDLDDFNEHSDYKFGKEQNMMSENEDVTLNSAFIREQVLNLKRLSDEQRTFYEKELWTEYTTSESQENVQTVAFQNAENEDKKES